jgi:O-antigen/teichoic acid export membrane protein
LGIIRNTAAVGQYAALAQLGLASMAIFSNYLTQMGVPVLYSLAGDGRDHSRRARADRLNMMLLLSMFIVTLLILVGAGLFHREIFSIFVAEDFRDVSALLPVAILAGGLSGCGQIASFIVLTGTESHPLIIPKSATAIVTASAVLVGANIAGISGVIWADVAGAMFYLVLIFIVKSRKRT